MSKYCAEVSEYSIAFQYLRVLQRKDRDEKRRWFHKNKERICTLSHLLSAISRKEKAGIKEDQETVYRTDYQAPRAAAESLVWS